MDTDVGEELAQLARTGQTDALMGLLGAHGLGVDVNDHKGDCLLMLAAYNGHSETVTALLAAGAKADVRNARGLSPLDGASFKGDLPVIDALLSGGAQVDAGGPDGKTALMWAAAFDRIDAVKLLLRYGASAAKTDAMGNKASAHAQNMGAANTLAVLDSRE